MGYQKNFFIDESAKIRLSAPTLGATLRLDEIITDIKPIFTWVNSTGGCPLRKYILQVDTSPSFDTQNLIEQREIPEGIRVTTVRIDKPLQDNTLWFWRVKAVDSTGEESPWSFELGGITARIFVDTAMGKKNEYMRVAVKDIKVSSGFGKEFIMDYNNENATYWEGSVHETSHWIQFDLGKPTPISRFFQTSGSAYTKDNLPKSSAGWHDRSNLDGRLSHFIWQYSIDGLEWMDISETERTDSDSFREIIDLAEIVNAQYFRLYIKAWHGQSPKIYDIMIYTLGKPSIPDVPEGNYVLVIDNYSDFISEPGKIKTDFGKMVRGMGGQIAPPWDLSVVELPAREFYVEILKLIKHKPVAIFLTGSTNFYCHLPMFEFNGEYELTRTTDIPTWGACAGLQLMAMAYGNTCVTSAGRYYETDNVEDIIKRDIPPINIQKDDPIFAGMCTPFYGTELHSLIVRTVPEGWELLASSQDSCGLICNEMIKAIGRPVYGSQFHPEIPHPFNCSKNALMNFLTMAVEKAKKEGNWIY